MDYVNLGRTGLKVSKLCLGTMTYGDKSWRDWILTEEESRPFYRQAWEAGINFYDTADIYSFGASEEVTGRALKELAPRDELVVATKVFNPMSKAPNDRGLSRKHILSAIDASLRRLVIDYVDLYQIHRFDPHTPIEETMEALHDVVRAGKARYIGASSMYAWQFAKALHVAERHGWTRFVSMQNYVNLLYREEEREMLPLCASEGVGVIPWSPMARGRLARDWREGSRRQDTDKFGATLYEKTEEADRRIIDEVGRIAEERGVSRAQVALAWVLGKPEVTAPIVGATKPHHLDDAVAALSLELTPEETERLERLYVPHAVTGFE